MAEVHITKPDVEKLDANLVDIGLKLDDLRKNETWRRKMLVLGGALLALVLVVALLNFSTSQKTSKTLSLIEDVISPTSCFGMLSKHSSDLRTWDIKRSVTRIARLPDPERPQPPSGLVEPKCRALYDSFEPSLPH